MKRQRQQRRERRAGGSRRVQEPSGFRGETVSVRRRWLFRFVAVFLLPLILLAGVEVALRLAGFGFNPGFFKRETVGGRDCFVANEAFGLRFFPRHMVRFPPPVVMPVVKAPETYRIFIFGESAAMGDPQPNYGAGAFLEALLSERFPGARFEVINTSVTAISSHVILPIARECAGHDGDLWIVYMGNNEMVGPFGAATVFVGRAPPLWMIRTQVQLRRLRLGQLLLESVRKLRKSGSPEGWYGMEMFVQNQVPPDDPRRKRVYGSFRRNLEDILDAGLSSGARVVLSTVAVNLKDCPPFGSLPETELSSADGIAFAKFSQDGAAALAVGRFQDGQSAFEQALEIHPQSAEAQFQVGASLLHLAREEDALKFFLQAVDHDTLPFRADSRINENIRAAAEELAGKSLVLCDAARTLNTASPGGIAGAELFYEHVHLNPNGNYALALAWASAVEEMLPPTLKRGAQASWVSQPECEQRLGLTDWNRVSILEHVLQRIQRPPFNNQSGHAQHVKQVEKEIVETRQRLTEEAAVEARSIYLKALQRAPDDFRLHANYAEFLETRREWLPAIAARKRVLELVQDSYFSHYALGVVLKEAGSLAEAREVLLRAAALKPDDADIRLELGMVAAREQDWEQARRELELARRSGSGDPRIPLYLGEVLWKLNRHDEAIESLREATRLDPTNWRPHYRLAENLAQRGHFSQAASEYMEVLRLDPDRIRARLGLAGCLAQLGQHSEALQQLDHVLQRDPSNEAAREIRRKILER